MEKNQQIPTNDMFIRNILVIVVLWEITNVGFTTLPRLPVYTEIKEKMSDRRNYLCWASLHNHSSMSLLDGLSKPEDLIERAVKNNIVALSLSDHGTCAGLVKFQKAKKKVVDKLKGTEWEDSAKQIKLINACELYIKVDEKINSHLVVLAKNAAGYKTLIKLASEATRPENRWRKPRLSIEQIANINKDKNLFSFSGHPGSDLGNFIFADLKGAYNASSEAECRQYIHPECKKRLLEKADEYVQAFGKDNFALEVQLFDAKRLPAQTVIAKAMRWLSKETGLRCVSSCDSHYVKEEDCEDQRILLSSSLRVTLPQIYKQLANDDDDVALGGFFKSSKYYLTSAEEIATLHNEDEVKYAVEIAQSIEEYDLFSKPVIPDFPCPNGMSSDNYMKELCRRGWKDKLSFNSKEEKNIYADRVKYELEVLQSAGLSNYFLIVQDIVNYAKSQGFMVGPGRGSVGGSLVAYLMGITSIDSIKYDLVFERFYNAGRNSPGHISLPDIDMDFQASARESVIQYIKDKYGHNKVAQIGNFGRMMGRACLKDVLRAHEAADATTQNKICSFLIDESAISDELQQMEEEEGQSSIIKWALENNAKELSEWAWLSKDGKSVEGPLGKHFEQAMRLEGTYRQKGKHAAGYVIYPTDVTDVCPVVYTKDGEMELDFDMWDVEYTGGVKMDILTVKVLDKVKVCQDMIKGKLLCQKSSS